MEEKKGLIFNIQRFSLHDGPGIRSTVFMKGCPLRCQWCSNPESWHPYPEIMAHDRKCLKCGRCAGICPVGAITVSPEARRIDRAKCSTSCLECAQVCSNGAITASGSYVSVGEVMAEVESDRLFYEHSGGGVTVSGGEPLLQWEFVSELLKRAKGKGLHTALETCGYGPWDRTERVLEHVDLVLYDIKHMDPAEHREGTSKSNSLILRNAEKIAARKVRLWLRFPLLPGYNDAKEHVEEVVAFGLKIGAEKVSILPFHGFGIPKYEQLGRRYTFGQVESPPEADVQRVRESIVALGLKADIGR